MKKTVCILLIFISVCALTLTSCTNDGDTFTTPAVTDTEAATVWQTDTEPETDPVTTAPRTETEPATESETEPPAPSPYGMFGYDGNKINVSVSSPYAILIDANTNEILYITGDPEARIYPASTTKLLTAIVAIKNCPTDEVFKPGDELSLVAKDSSVAYVKKNHELSLDMLIEGMMLPSGGDAAYVVAAGVGRKIAGDETLTGTAAVSVFMDEMNRYGKEVLGLRDTNFTCPDGYHDDDHYTTLIDIMTIARAAMSEPLIMKYAGMFKDDVRYASGHKNTWTNTNLLLDPDSKYFYENATGMKTGTTDEAGCCLIASAAIGTKKVLAGVFGAENTKTRFNDGRTLLVVGINR